MGEIEVKEIFIILKKRILILVLAITLIVMSTWFVTYYLIKPQYEAFTTLMVGKSQTIEEKIEYSDVLLNQKLISTYGEIVKSKIIITQAVKNIGANISYQELIKNIEVTMIKDSEIIMIKVLNNDPYLAANIANEIAKVFILHINNTLKIDNVQIIDIADIPIKPAKPKLILNMIIAGILGVLITIPLILFFEYINKKIRSQKDIEMYLETLTLGVIPKEKIRKKESKIIEFDKNIKNIYSEAYRTLRTNIQFLSINKEIKSIVVTSPEPADGKSTVICNLAVAISITKKRVLIVDTDLRNPKIHEMYGLINENGLTNILAGDTNYEDAIINLGQGYPNILTSGYLPPNPSELLSSNKMQQFIEDIKDKYDVVLFDSPPVGFFTDAAILSTITDGVILVVVSDKTKIEDAKNAKILLEKVHANILGTVLNKMVIKLSKYGKYPYDKTKPKKNKENKQDVRHSLSYTTQCR